MRPAHPSSLARLAFLAAAALACASGSPHGLVRVDLPDPRAAGPGSPDEQQLAAAIRDAAGAEGLACQPGVGASLLRCSAAAVGSRGHAITIGLERSGTGYEVAIAQAFHLPGRASPVCEVQRRVADRIDSEVGFPVSHVDRRSDCTQK
jgi:hypothetical protein